MCYLACGISFSFQQANPMYNSGRCHVFTCDVTSDHLTDYLAPDSVDIALMLFVLSAISPEKMVAALKNTHQVRLFSI